MPVDKWAYECPRGKDGLHTWRRTGEREEIACVHCKLTLSKSEAAGLGFEPCRHLWKPVTVEVGPIIYDLEIPTKPEPFRKRCIVCGATG